MAKTESVFQFVQSLTKPEKRYFRLYSDLYKGNKNYMELFDLFLKPGMTFEKAKETYRKQPRKITFEPACNHLYKVLVRSLINQEDKSSIEYRLLQNILEVRVLFKKSLLEECFRLLEKTRQLALKYEKFSIYQLVANLEIQYHNRLHFTRINSENELIIKQSAIKENLQKEMLINEHSSIYDLISYRYVQHGPVRNTEEKEKLNDLVFAEMNITNDPKYTSFENKKIHLLFQSVYFLMTGDHKSSLRTSYELNDLFEKNRELWLDPPVYYIYLLRGILDNLLNTKQLVAMPFFIEKLENIKHQYRLSDLAVDFSVFEYKTKQLITQGKFRDAMEIVKLYNNRSAGKLSLLTPNEQATFYLIYSVIYFGLEAYKNAGRCLKKMINPGTAFRKLSIYKSIHLFYLVVLIEQDDPDFIRYEIRNLERILDKDEKFYPAERVLLDFMKQACRGKSKKEFNMLCKNSACLLRNMKKDIFDVRISRIFDVLSWFESKFERKSYMEKVREKYG